MKSVTILGMRVDCVSPAETLTAIDQFVALKTPHHIVTADASMVVTARHDPELHAIIDAADLVTPDGAGILWASRLFGTPIPHRVSGVDLVGELCRLSPSKGYRLFFFGSGPRVAEEAAVKMRAHFPGTQIVGTRDGYFSAEQEPEIVAQIQATQADIVLVALGIPKQEKWIAKHKAELGASVLIGVGGSFDVFSGRVKRAPLIMQRNGFEWLYRLLQNPKKINKVLTLPEFALLALRQRFWRSRVTAAVLALLVTSFSAAGHS
jgi:N-acetylglucosaminyldiphosphoundecaprenol N-acetyl-beta-D-mannosaminyltransferase